MAYKGDGGRNRGAGRRDSNPGAMHDRERGKGGGDNRRNKNPAINPGNPNLGLAGPNYSGKQGAGTGVNAANPNNEPGTPRAPRDGGVGGLGWDSDFGPAPSSLNGGQWGGGYGPSITNGASGVPVDIDKFMHDWADYQGIGYGDVSPDTWADKFANYVAGLFGFNEMNPLNDKSYGTPGTDAPGTGARWGFDYGQTLAGLAGSAFGIPATGLGFAALKKMGVLPEDFGVMNVGTSVFGGPTRQTAANPDIEPGGVSTPAPVARSRAPDNVRLSGYSGGGYNMGAFGKKPSKKTNYLTQQLMAP